MKSKYDDIINFPHHVSQMRGHMSAHDRAAQFSPFAALTGYDAAIAETARLTSGRVELTDERMEILNARLQLLLDEPAHRAKITYFQPDERKEGGAYTELVGHVKRFDSVERLIIMADGTKIPIGELYDVEIFSEKT